MTRQSGRGPVSRVGFVGLGTMGRPMANNILASDFPLAVNHHSQERVHDLIESGATWCPTGRDLAQSSDIIISMLPDLPELETVLWGEAGVASATTAPLVLVICSTSSAHQIRDLSMRLAHATDGRIHVVDSPVSGGEEGAKSASLSLFVGGDSADVEVARPALSATGVVHHLGPLGAGSIAKYCNQLIVAATVHAIAEASVIADHSGLHLDELFDALSGGYAGSRVLETRAARMVADDYHPSGAARYMVKDLGYAREEAERAGVSAHQLDFLSDTFRDLQERGWGDNDISVIRAYVRVISKQPREGNS